MERYVVASSRAWHKPMFERLSAAHEGAFTWVDAPEQLTVAHLETLDPSYVFFPHWSHIIPEEVFARWECVIFHMTDVPYGRGGSPLQNLIVQGVRETQLSAIRCVAELDAGPVYSKRPLSLDGSAQEIYLRASGITEELISWIIGEAPEPVPQEGEVVTFSRRTPDQSVLVGESLDRVYDHIRMLDAEGYPHAFLELDDVRLEFRNARKEDERVVAEVEITMRREGDEA